MSRTPRALCLTLCLVGLSLSPAAARSVSDSQACDIAKSRSAGRYSQCLLRAERKALRKNTATDTQSCEAAFERSWLKAEARYGDACPTTGDLASTGLALDYAAANVPGGARAITQFSRGQLIVEVSMPGPVPFSNVTFECEACHNWSALDPAETDALVAAFVSASLPPGFTAGSQQVFVLQSARSVGLVATNRPGADVLPDVPGDEFRLIAQPTVVGFVGTDGSQQIVFPPNKAWAAFLVDVVSDRSHAWNAGDEIHELIAPDGTTYVLFGIEYGTDPAAFETSFPVAEGWISRYRRLEDDLVLDSEGLARVYIAFPGGHIWQRLSP